MNVLLLLIAVSLAWAIGQLLVTGLVGRGRDTRLLRWAVALPLGLAAVSAGRFAVFMLLPAPLHGRAPAVVIDTSLLVLLTAVRLVVAAKKARPTARPPAPLPGPRASPPALRLSNVEPNRRAGGDTRGPGSAPWWEGRSGIAARVAVLLLLGLSGWRTVRELQIKPDGEFDAISIWNVRARFLHRAGENWRDAFVASVHADYPLNLPFSIERLWRYAGGETLLAPAGLALLSMGAVIAILFAAVRHAAGTMRACVAVAALLALPLFLETGTYQYADVPLATLMLGSVAAVWVAHDSPIRGRWLVLAGTLAGGAAWTKNEGLLWVPALGVGVVAAEFVWSRPRESLPLPASPMLPLGPRVSPPALRFRSINRRAGGDTRGPGGAFKGEGRRAALHVLAFALGALPFVALVCWMKLSLSASNDVLSAQAGQSTMEKLLNPTRHAEIWKGVWRHVLWPLDHHGGTTSVRLPGNFVLWVLPVYLLAAGASLRPPGRGRALTATLVALGILLAGFYGIYLITPLNLPGHIVSSITRLLVQVYPILLLVIFAAARPVEDMWSNRSL